MDFLIFSYFPALLPIPSAATPSELQLTYLSSSTLAAIAPAQAPEPPAAYSSSSAPATSALAPLPKLLAAPKQPLSSELTAIPKSPPVYLSLSTSAVLPSIPVY